MAYIDFDGIKEKLKDTYDVVAGATREFAGKAAEKTKNTARIAKLKLEIGSEKDGIKKAYLEIGKLYYEMHRDDPDGFFAQLCDEITVANANIESMEQEIADLKNGVCEEDFEVEFTECGEDEDCCCDEGCCGCDNEEAHAAEDETSFCPEDGEKDE